MKKEKSNPAQAQDQGQFQGENDNVTEKSGENGGDPGFQDCVCYLTDFDRRFSDGMNMVERDRLNN